MVRAANWDVLSLFSLPGNADMPDRTFTDSYQIGSHDFVPEWLRYAINHKIVWSSKDGLMCVARQRTGMRDQFGGRGDYILQLRDGSLQVIAKADYEMWHRKDVRL